MPFDPASPGLLPRHVHNPTSRQHPLEPLDLGITLRTACTRKTITHTPSFLRPARSAPPPPRPPLPRRRRPTLPPQPLPHHPRLHPTPRALFYAFHAPVLRHRPVEHKGVLRCSTPPCSTPVLRRPFLSSRKISGVALPMGPTRGEWGPSTRPEESGLPAGPIGSPSGLRHNSPYVAMPVTTRTYTAFVLVVASWWPGRPSRLYPLPSALFRRARATSEPSPAFHFL